MNNVDIAKICHVAHIAYSKSIGENPSEKSWDELDEWLKKENLISIDFAKSLNIVKHHNALVNYRIKNGWKFGSIKNETNKEHPNLIKYSSLLENQKKKYKLFRAIVKSLS